MQAQPIICNPRSDILGTVLGILHRSGERTAAGSGKPLTEGHGGSVSPPFHPILIRKGIGSVHDENVEPTAL